MGITRNQYGEVERGEIAISTIGPIPNVGELAAHERCLLHRRRAGARQEDCAKEIGITRFWYNQMEKGHADCKPLLDFWEG